MIHDAADVRPAAFLISSLINQSLAHLFMIKLISSPPWPARFSIFRLASICEYFTGSCFLLNSAFLSLSKRVMQRSETKSGFCGFWSNRTLPYFPLSSVRPPPSQAWHINFSQYFDDLYHENHIFSECISSRLVVLATLTTWTTQTTWTTWVTLITWINWTT